MLVLRGRGAIWARMCVVLGVCVMLLCVVLRVVIANTTFHTQHATTQHNTFTTQRMYSAHGIEYIRDYRIDGFPHLAVLDPGTLKRIAIFPPAS